ncbi:hypothetical protein LguiA_001243 [Lonicera macranthoides]
MAEETTTVTAAATASTALEEAVKSNKVENNKIEVQKNRIQVSNTKKPLFFYLNLAKRYIKQHDDVELSALGMDEFVEGGRYFFQKRYFSLQWKPSGLGIIAAAFLFCCIDILILQLFQLL